MGMPTYLRIGRFIGTVAFEVSAYECLLFASTRMLGVYDDPFFDYLTMLFQRQML